MNTIAKCKLNYQLPNWKNVIFLWTMKDYCLIEVKANKILQGEIVTKSTLLFQNVILLELLSKYFAENKNQSVVNT